MLFFISFCSMFFIKINIFIVAVLWVEIVIGEEECKYKVDFTANLDHCENFKNEKFDPTPLKMTQSDTEDESGEKPVGVAGYLELSVDLIEGWTMNLNIMQETETGRNPVMSVSSEVCKSLNDTNAPWWPFVEAMNVTSCPMKAGKYDIKEIIFISLGFADGCLNKNYEGEYAIEVTIMDKMDTLGCWIFACGISEYGC